MKIDNEIIKDIVKKMINFEKEIFMNIEKEEIPELVNFIFYNKPFIFHIDEYSFSYDERGKIATFYPHYVMEKKVYDDLLQKVLDKLNIIKEELDKMTSLYEKEIYIHDYFCKNVIYDKNEKEAYNILGPLLKGKGVCEGIAKATNLVFKIAGIESLLIYGKSYQNNHYAPHSWNLINLNGKYFHIDITYDICLSKKKIMYDYFNLSNQEIKIDHFSDVYPSICQKAVFDEDYFVYNKLFFTKKDDLYEYMKCMIKKGENYLYFECNFILEEDEIKDYLFSFKKVKTFQLRINKERNIFSIFLNQ